MPINVDALLQRLRALEEKDARRRAIKAAAMKRWRKRHRNPNSNPNK